MQKHTDLCEGVKTEFTEKVLSDGINCLFLSRVTAAASGFDLDFLHSSRMVVLE